MPVKNEPNPSKSSRSLVTTLAVAFVLLSVIPMLVVSALLGYSDLQTQQEAVFYQQRLTAAEAATEVSGFIERIFSALEASARMGQVSDQEQQQLILERLLGFEDALRELALVDGSGQAVAVASRRSSVASSNLLKLAKQDLLAQVGQEQRFISEVYFDEETSEPLVSLAVPMKDVFGDFKGALLAEVNLKFMWDVVDRLQVGETGTAYVVNKQGDLIAFDDAGRVLRGENLGQLTEVAEFIEGQPVDEREAYSTGINGSAVVGTYVPLGAPDWAVVTEIPVEEAYQGSLYTASILLGIVLLIAVLAAGAGVYASRYLTTPLLNLTQTASRLAAGEIGLQAATEGPAEVGQLANAFNAMTTQLRELIGSLEERVAARTHRLETIAAVSERLNAILNLEQLLQEMVAEIKEKFDYYHAQVYILDDPGQNLVLAAGVGEAGAQMRARGHQIPLDAVTSLVARAARTGEVVRVDNVREAPDWLPNPLLPETYSEMAVPISSEEKVVGVLDVQQNRVAGLDEGDASLLRSLAGQIATAVRNARLFTQTQAALDEAQRLQRLYMGETWERLIATRSTTDYEYRHGPLPPLSEITTPEAVAALQQGQTVRLETERKQVADGKLNAADEPAYNPSSAPIALATPLKLRDEIIGILGLHAADSQRSWTEDEIALIESVSEQMALAIENARLFEDTQRSAWRDQVVSETTAKVWSSAEIEEVLRTAVAQLGDKLRASEVVIRLGTEAELAQE
ncbi:MAG: GAF domain-containing protein [Anaerolineae bacterium]|nr:GAF domain-containing protein [Anaerolineae bacterium]